MLDARYVADHLDEVRSRLATRSASAAALVDGVTDLALRRRALIQETEQKQSARNLANDQMAKLAKTDRAAFEARRDELKTVSAEIKDLEGKLAEIESALEEKLLGIPNLPHESVPKGSGSDDNPVVRTWGEKPKLDFEPKAHDELGVALGIIDFERARKLSGARFGLLRGHGAKLERALIHFFLELHTCENGYTEIQPPYLVKASALVGTGQLPKFEADLFKTHRHAPPETQVGAGTEDESDTTLYLIPTAEVPLTSMLSGEILELDALPLAYTAYTPCFRSEAGSYGKDVRGLIRVHQFDKVELVRISEPEKSLESLEELTRHAAMGLERLGLHHRVVELCAADLGSSATKTYDLEVWLPGQSAYREISSCSNCGDYQARRAQIRYRPAPKGKPRLVHTLNGSGLAIGRTLVAILEQYQQKDGSVLIPEALRPFMGIDRIT